MYQPHQQAYGNYRPSRRRAPASNAYPEYYAVGIQPQGNAAHHRVMDGVHHNRMSHPHEHKPRPPQPHAAYGLHRYKPSHPEPSRQHQQKPIYEGRKQLVLLDGLKIKWSEYQDWLISNRDVRSQTFHSLQQKLDQQISAFGSVDVDRRRGESPNYPPPSLVPTQSVGPGTMATQKKKEDMLLRRFANEFPDYSNRLRHQFPYAFLSGGGTESLDNHRNKENARPKTSRMAEDPLRKAKFDYDRKDSLKQSGLNQFDRVAIDEKGYQRFAYKADRERRWAPTALPTSSEFGPRPQIPASAHRPHSGIPRAGGSRSVDNPYSYALDLSNFAE